jgi:predicted metal-dependent HD superfamily phosphohydrolase
MVVSWLSAVAYRETTMINAGLGGGDRRWRGQDGIVDELLDRWRRVIGGGADELGRDLLRRWSEPRRKYHTTDHLRAVLDAVDVLEDHAHDPDAVRLAAWFHDAVYHGRPGDDETASARLAAETLPGAGVDAERVREVLRLVELTASHDADRGDANGAVLCDADLAILGAEPEEYAAYAAAVRAEYSHVSDRDFNRGRAEVLRRLLALDPLYRTPTGRAHWDATARRNLSAELDLLSVS